MTSAIRDYFEDRAPTWNSMMPDHLDEALRRMVAPFAGTFRAARAVLEIGTGTGALIPHLMHCAPDMRLVSIDLAHGMLVQARERCPHARLVEADAHWLPFAAGQQSWFDVVVCHNSFPHFADRVRALDEIRRVLCPGGQLFILHNNPRERVNAIHSRAAVPLRLICCLLAKTCARCWFGPGISKCGLMTPVSIIWHGHGVRSLPGPKRVES